MISTKQKSADSLKIKSKIRKFRQRTHCKLEGNNGNNLKKIKPKKYICSKKTSIEANKMSCMQARIQEIWRPGLIKKLRFF